MNGDPDYRDLLSAFEKEGVRYLVVGAHAVMYHTEPRYTKDLDIWVEPTRKNAEKVYRALAGFGAPLRGIAVEDFLNPQLVYQVGLEPHRIDILMGISGLRFETAWRRRERGFYDELRVNVLGRAELLKNKRQVGRPVDLIDVQALEASARIRRTKGRRKRRVRGR
ncbi:MAG: hypothetical protein HY721_34955 [Planctomycetes bacterium]|nr:hypothetical protein [Planctomycetota bacterium]